MHPDSLAASEQTKQASAFCVALSGSPGKDWLFDESPEALNVAPSQEGHAIGNPESSGAEHGDSQKQGSSASSSHQANEEPNKSEPTGSRDGNGGQGDSSGGTPSGSPGGSGDGGNGGSGKDDRGKDDHGNGKARKIGDSNGGEDAKKTEKTDETDDIHDTHRTKKPSMQTRSQFIEEFDHEQTKPTVKLPRHSMPSWAGSGQTPLFNTADRPESLASGSTRPVFIFKNLPNRACRASSDARGEPTTLSPTNTRAEDIQSSTEPLNTLKESTTTPQHKPKGSKRHVPPPPPPSPASPRRRRWNMSLSPIPSAIPSPIPSLRLNSGVNSGSDEALIGGSGRPHSVNPSNGTGGNNKWHTISHLESSRLERVVERVQGVFQSKAYVRRQTQPMRPTPFRDINQDEDTGGISASNRNSNTRGGSATEAGNVDNTDGSAPEAGHGNRAQTGGRHAGSSNHQWHMSTSPQSDSAFHDAVARIAPTGLIPDSPERREAMNLVNSLAESPALSGGRRTTPSFMIVTTPGPDLGQPAATGQPPVTGQGSDQERIQFAPDPTPAPGESQNPTGGPENLTTRESRNSSLDRLRLFKRPQNPPTEGSENQATGGPDNQLRKMKDGLLGRLRIARSWSSTTGGSQNQPTEGPENPSAEGSQKQPTESHENPAAEGSQNQPTEGPGNQLAREKRLVRIYNSVKSVFQGRNQAE